MRLKQLGRVAVAALAVTAFAACSDDDDDAPTDTGGGDVTTPEVTEATTAGS